MATLRFVDPSATSTVEVGGVTFTFGFWPPREAEKISADRDRIGKISKEERDTPDARALSHDVHRRMVQFGVRSFTGMPEGAIETEEIYGIKYSRVSDAVLHQLYLNSALWPVGLACMKWNDLGPEEKKTSG